MGQNISPAVKPNQFAPIETLQTSTPQREVATEIRYRTGGLNYFVGKSIPRGYYLRVRIQTNQNGKITWTPSETVEELVEPAKRFSQKMLHQLVAGIRQKTKYTATLEHGLALTALELTT